MKVFARGFVVGCKRVLVALLPPNYPPFDSKVIIMSERNLQILLFGPKYTTYCNAIVKRTFWILKLKKPFQRDIIVPYFVVIL